MKGDSQSSSREISVDNSVLMSAKPDKSKKTPGRVDATTIVKNLLEQREGKSQKLYNLVSIIADPHFLECCYNEIKSKPGNMTKGVGNETLDGLN